ncbi:MAG TPA: hypothetical protein VKG84_02540 [Candidatus Acidoferrales bacterium]|nr:hypothetical protein [Candidatus Acidoferrales bacterium]
MNPRRSLLLIAGVIAASLALSACGSSNSSSPNLPIAVSFSAVPPSTVNAGAGFMVTAIVSNDSSGKGVNWSCAPAGSCGSFSPTQTASGAASTYTAPATVPTGGSVTITAASISDSTKVASANVTVAAGGAVALTFNAPAPPSTLTLSGNTTLSATVNSTVVNAVNDGVDWTSTCTVGSGCGLFSSAHTASGATTTYTAPPSVPAGGLTVTVTAASTFASASTVTAVIFVSATQTSAFLCAGCSYTYTVAGTDTVSNFGLAGVFSVDGNGNVTGGEQDFADLAGATLGSPETVLSGTYSFTPDGRGIITLVLDDTTVGVGGVETFGVALVSANHMLLTELDSSATASGSMDRQTLTSFSPSSLSGNYTYVAGGLELVNGFPLGFGGVFVVSSPGTISSTSGVCDANDGGFVSTQQGYTSGSGYSGPDQFGRTQITLRPNFIGDLDGRFQLNLAGPVILASYINDVTHVKFVEVDFTFGVTSGVSVGQGKASGTITTASAALPANSSYVLDSFGTGVVGPLAFATTFTSDGVSKLQNGFSDLNSGGTSSSGALTGTYTVDPAGTGRVGATLNGNFGAGNTAAYAIYLTGGADPAMVLELDGNAVSTGSNFAQASGSFTLASFKGPYALNFTLFPFDTTDQMFDIEIDVSGQTVADGAGNLLGTLDVNNFGQPIPDVPATGAYASAASGRFTGSLTPSGSNTLAISYFVVSPSTVVFIETDTGVSLGLFQIQQPPF